MERLPTRVSKACDRCRKKKQRCDFFHPCRHCARARTECTLTPINDRHGRHQRVAGRPKTTLSPAVSQAVDLQSTPSQSVSDPEAEQYGITDQNQFFRNVPRNASTSQSLRPTTPKSQPQKETSALPDLVGPDSALAITRKIFRYQQSLGFKDRATSAIPGGDLRNPNSSVRAAERLTPVAAILGTELPPHLVCNKLLETYFSTVHWFSLVIYEPKFRIRYDALMESGMACPSDRGFLLLLIMVLSMGCWYSSKNDPTDADGALNNLEMLRSQLLKIVQEQFMELLDEDSLEFVQLCALLGSFYLYHGRPRSAFSLLGAATKTSQAMDLHRDNGLRWSFEDIEERKRVWWTIYTWDRFATITYGRPLGINDKDCNVEMPSSIFENVHFDRFSESPSICLSTYQTQLNLVYRIASPLLENIYGIRTLHDTELRSQLPVMIATAYQVLLQWQADLPPHLSFDCLDDLTGHSSTAEKMHSLQALSLQLTYDNLIIVLHRPLLAYKSEIQRQAAAGMVPDSSFTEDVQEVGFRRCLSSAIRISKVHDKQNLIALARNTHLISFLGMNLFTASVVLFICALSNTLSDTAQDAKRGLKRTLQMQRTLSTRASLSMQCSMILEDLVQLILKKEMEDMLRDGSKSNDQVETIRTAYEEDSCDIDKLGNVTVSSTHFDQDIMRSAVYDSQSDCRTQVEDSHFAQSLISLHKVIQDNNFSWPLPGTDNAALAQNEYDTFGMSTSAVDYRDGGRMDTNNFGIDDGSSTRVEDLGQFWLWSSTL